MIYFSCNFKFHPHIDFKKLFYIFLCKIIQPLFIHRIIFKLITIKGESFHT